MSQSEDGNSKIGDHIVGVFGYLAWEATTIVGHSGSRFRQSARYLS